MSVPHTGTRTLQEYLGSTAFWHFSHNWVDIQMWQGTVHVPIRDPFDVAMSWKARYKDSPEMNQKGLNTLWDRLIGYTRNRPDTFFHKIEDISIRKGEGPKHWAKDKKNRKKARDTDEARELVRWMREHPYAEIFFARFYDDLWWMR